MQLFIPFIGFDWLYRKMENGEMETNFLGQKSTKAVRSVFSAGSNYNLPTLIIAQAEIFTDGNFRVQFERKDIPV